MHHEQRPPSQSRPPKLFCPLWRRLTLCAGLFQPHWLEQRWQDKVAAGFTNSASQRGDKLSTLMQLNVFAMQMGMILAGVGDLPGNNWSGGARTDLNRLGTWLGHGTKQCRRSNAERRGHRHRRTRRWARRDYRWSSQRWSCIRVGAD